MQSCHESDSGVIVETVFVHESGETMSAGKLHVPAAGKTCRDMACTPQSNKKPLLADGSVRHRS